MQWLRRMSLKLKLDHIQVTDLKFETSSFDQNITDDVNIKLQFRPLFANTENTEITEDKENTENTRFALHFKLHLENTDGSFLLKASIIAHFATEPAFNEEFKTSSFVRVNAPAIAFPFIRTFVSNLTLNAGYRPVVLDSINFVKFDERNRSDETEGEVDV